MSKKFIWLFITFGLMLGGVSVLTNRLLEPMLRDQAASGQTISISGWPGGHMTVKANSEVCVKGISEDFPFDVTTPSGKFVSDTQIGKYYFGEGCYEPGTWDFTGNVPAMVLKNPEGVSALSVTPGRVKYELPRQMFATLAIFLFLGYVFTIWATSRTDTTEDQAR